MVDPESLAYKLSRLRPQLVEVNPNEAESFLAKKISKKELKIMKQAGHELNQLLSQSLLNEQD